MNTEPDGLLGAMIASEALGLTETLVNGAGGCRSRAQIMMHMLDQSYRGENWDRMGSSCYSRQSRLPCTFLNGDDIVFGSAGKVSDSMASARGPDGRGVILLDTLGASLICTDRRSTDPCGSDGAVFVDGDLSGMSFREGFDRTVGTILSSADLEEGDDGTVNLLGYGIMDPGWEYGAEELRSLLSLMDIEVNTIVGCKGNRDVRRCGTASLNVMIRPEYCSVTADSLRSLCGTPTLRLDAGAPVGYDSTRSFVIQVAEAMDRDPAPALDRIDRDMRKVHSILMENDRIPRGLHGRGMEMEGTSSTVYPLLRWMVEKFGMAPRRIHVTDGAYLDGISGYLSSIGFGDALEGRPEQDPDVMFCDGIRALEGRLSAAPTSFVEIEVPRGRTMDLMGRCVVGTAGCRYILDEVFNNATRFRCGQPTDMDSRRRPCGSSPDVRNR